jgi:hypothetical protein
MSLDYRINDSFSETVGIIAAKVIVLTAVRKRMSFSYRGEAVERSAVRFTWDQANKPTAQPFQKIKKLRG